MVSIGCTPKKKKKGKKEKRKESFIQDQRENKKGEHPEVRGYQNE